MPALEVAEADVRSLRLFARLPSSAAADLAKSMRVRGVGRGALIFVAGEPTEHVAFVLRGTVRMFRDTPDGHEQTLQVLRSGEALNLVGVLPGSVHPATAQAATDSDIATISTMDLTSLAQSHRELAWAVAQELARRLRQAQDRIFDLTLRSAAGRIASILLQMAERDGRRLPDGRYVLEDGLSHRELGLLAGLTRETTTRVLQRLREGGAVRRTDDGRVLLDPGAIASWLDPARER